MSSDPAITVTPAPFRYRGPDGAWLTLSGLLSAVILIPLWYRALFGWYGIYGPAFGEMVMLTLSLPFAVAAGMLFRAWISVTADDHALRVRHNRDAPVQIEFSDIEQAVLKEGRVYESCGIPTENYTHVKLKSGKTVKFTLPGGRQERLMEFLKGRAVPVEIIVSENKPWLEHVWQRIADGD